jgi:hypothetical protein
MQICIKKDSFAARRVSRLSVAAFVGSREKRDSKTSHYSLELTMKYIAFYTAIVLAALISCTSAEAKRHHHDGKHAVAKMVSIKHSTRVRHRRGGRHLQYAAYAGCRERRRTRHHRVYYYRQDFVSRRIESGGPYYQLVLWDGTLTGPIAPDANGG